jgi:ABC-type multidrug transport system fused ATPase/permease subunit
VTDPSETDDSEARPAAIPWRRLTGLLRPLHRGIAAMVGLSVGGVLVGLVPPLALGVLVDALIENNDKAEAAVMTGVIVLAITIEATAYVLSDGMYARNASSLYRNLRMQMFDGAARRPSTLEGTSGLASRFISDAETLEQVTMSLIDSGTPSRASSISATIPRRRAGSGLQPSG